MSDKVSITKLIALRDASRAAPKDLAGVINRNAWADAWAEYQARMLTGQTRVVRETPNGSRIVAYELTDVGRQALTVRPRLHPEVQPPRSRHRRTAFWTAAFVLWAALCFAAGASAASTVMLVHDALVKSEPTTGEALVQWMQGGVR